MIKDHEDVREFLNRVCSEIRSREAHPQIRLELMSHLESLAEEKEQAGESREEALAWAVAQMGDPRLIGKDLHRIHRPKLEWGLLTAILAFVALGLIAMYAYDASMLANSKQTVNSQFFIYKVAMAGIGLAVMGGLTFFSYHKFQALTWWLYGLLIIGLCLVALFGNQVNGSRQYLSFGPLYIQWASISPLLFVVVAAGCLPRWYAARSFFMARSFALFLPVGLLLSICSAMPALLLTMVGYLIIIGSVTKRWKTLLVLVSASILAISSFLLWYAPSRLQAFLSPEKDPNGASYVYMKIAELQRTSGWFGQGFGTALPSLPNMYSEFIFTFLIYCFGWLAGILFALAALYLVSRFRHSFIQVRDPFGRHLVLGLSSIIVFQFAYNLLMSIGLLPYIGLSLPFVSYGLYPMLYEMAAVGLILSIYRRKDLMSSRSGPVTY
ncbi:FtsW/RodA/SpoVE family cell cycle protein [Paenibacillus filicis]|uniref:FtsW/RodA/SpoVE family cell cycle protein n=1 Tax=Paenibacillus filicis TaxID=669464 RepID=A0ABU9DSD0_9BACL